jgi:hypothetical protein
MQTNQLLPLSVIFIPDWICKAVRRECISAECYLDPDSLYKLVSAEDLSIMYCLNDKMSQMFQDPSFKMTLQKYWGDSSIFLHTVEPLSALSTPVMETRLFDATLRDQKSPQAFRIFDLTKNVIGVEIQPGFFCCETLEDSKASLEMELLRQFHSRETVPNLAGRLLFQNHVKRMLLPA